MEVIYEPFSSLDYPVVRLSTIIIYAVYFAMMWPIVGMMIIGLRKIADRDQRLISKRLTMANLFLVSGDSAMFICWLLLFLNYEWANSLVFDKGMLSIVPLGIVTTSLTMSVYYFYLYLFYKDRFKQGNWNWVGSLILILFLARIALHYNPYNIWLNMDPDFSSEPNYSAWIRNAPLFAYGLLIVSLIHFYVRRSAPSSGTFTSLNSDKMMGFAMICLFVSFLFYGVDIFFSHAIPNSAIWITYTLKTFAYIAAAWLMYRSQFKPSRQAG